MTEEQVGSAEQTVTPGVQAVAPPATPAAQPAEVTPAVSDKPPSRGEGEEAPRINWEDASNPYLQRWRTQEGIVKSEQARRRQVEQELNAARQHAQLLEQDRQHLTLAQQEAELDALLQGDPEEVVEKLRAKRAEQKQLRQWQQQQAPAVAQQTYQQAYSDYVKGFVEISQELGLKPEVVRQLSDEHPNDLVALTKGWGRKVAETLSEPVLKEIKESNAQALKALREELLADRRASERSPDTSTGVATTGVDDERTFIADFAAGKSDDMKRAKAYIDKLRS